MDLKTSVLIPSYRRPAALERCLRALAAQTLMPGEVIVVWQADDTPTRAAAEALRTQLPFNMVLVHCEQRGVVPAENAALDVAAGDVVLLIDDDAVAPIGWVERHLSFYTDEKTGAVGGPARNFHPDGASFADRAVEPIGRLKWNGRLLGNMYDQPVAWQNRAAIEVDHLVGYNMSLRRAAFDRFESALREYWQLFELDACLQVRQGGFRVKFDFGNVVEHHPTNTAYVPGRDGDLQIKIYNPAYNHGYILGKHLPAGRAWAASVRQYWIGSSSTPGWVGMFVGIRRYGQPSREWRIRRMTRRWWLMGRRAAIGMRAGAVQEIRTAAANRVAGSIEARD